MFEARFGNEYLEQSAAPGRAVRGYRDITVATLRRCSLAPLNADDLLLVHRKTHPHLYREDEEERATFEQGWEPAARTEDQTAQIVALFRKKKRS